MPLVRNSRLLLSAAALLALGSACSKNGGESELDRASAGAGSELVAEPLPASLKGYELYAWDDAASIRFTLTTGTNRAKTGGELQARDANVEEDGWVLLNRAGLAELRGVLKRVPEGTPVVLAQHPDLPALSAMSRRSVEQVMEAAGFAP